MPHTYVLYHPYKELPPLSPSPRERTQKNKLMVFRENNSSLFKLMMHLIFLRARKRERNTNIGVKFSLHVQQFIHRLFRLFQHLLSL